MAKRGPKPGTPSAKHGGEAVAAKYAGTTFYSEIGKKGGHALVEKVGTDGLAALGAKGGAATSRRYGTDHYRRMGHLTIIGTENRNKDDAPPANAMVGRLLAHLLLKAGQRDGFGEVW